MPYISTRTNALISKEQRNIIREKLGKSISLLNKSEEWLMLEFNSNCDLLFRGNDNCLIAYVEVKLYGDTNNELCDKMTNSISNILNEVLNIDMANIYVSYYPTDKWGWNGRNF